MHVCVSMQLMEASPLWWHPPPRVRERYQSAAEAFDARHQERTGRAEP